jgi:hypothetical protein
LAIVLGTLRGKQARLQNRLEELKNKHRQAGEDIVRLLQWLEPMVAEVRNGLQVELLREVFEQPYGPKLNNEVVHTGANWNSSFGRTRTGSAVDGRFSIVGTSSQIETSSSSMRTWRRCPMTGRIAGTMRCCDIELNFLVPECWRAIYFILGRRRMNRCGCSALAAHFVGGQIGYLNGVVNENIGATNEGVSGALLRKVRAVDWVTFGGVSSDAK